MRVVPMVNTSGRASKILTMGLQRKVERLRDRGLSYQGVADELYKDYPEANISKDAVWRYINGEGMKHRESKPISVIETTQDIFTDIYFKVDTLKSLSASDRRALQKYMRVKQSRLENKMSQYYRQNPDSGLSELELLRQVIADFSRNLCLTCRKIVLNNLSGEEEEIDISME